MSSVEVGRVLFVVETLGRGGTEESIRRFAAALVDRGIRCTVAHLFPPRSLTAELEAAGAEAVWLGAHGPAGLPAAAARLIRLERRLCPDVVHSHLYFAALATASASVAPGSRPRLLTLHGIDYHDPSRRWRRRVRLLAHRWALRRHRLLAVSDDVAEHFAEQFGLAQPPDVVANPVVEAPGREGAGSEGLIVCPARLVRPKRQEDLVSALPSLPGARLVLAGEGALRPLIERQVIDLGLQDSVEFRGEIDQEAVLALMREARVVALASDYEGFGMAVADAMALGVPVVATRVEGLREVIGDSRGAIGVEPGDVEGLGAALAQALDADRSVEMGRVARVDALRRYAPATITDQLLTHYREAIGHAG